MASFGGIYLTLHFHQVNLLILLFLWLFWRALRLGRAGYGAGAALALSAVAKPHYGLLLLAALQWPPEREPAMKRRYGARSDRSPEPSLLACCCWP